MCLKPVSGLARVCVRVCPVSEPPLHTPSMNQCNTTFFFCPSAQTKIELCQQHLICVATVGWPDQCVITRK
jgi:hypothetical protein